MEIFVDAGLFELAIAVAIGNTINFIIKKKYLLIIYSLIAILSPVLILFAKSGDLLYFLVSLNVVNGILLVLLLWRARQQSPTRIVFSSAKLKKQIKRVLSVNTQSADPN
jgi:MFS-type transporter involved in bile tolerance (Atg22 family)